MSTYSTIIERWWLVTFASFIVVLLLFLNHSPGSTNISVPQPLPVSIRANQFTISSSSQYATTNFTEQEGVSASFVQFPLNSSNLPYCQPLNFNSGIEQKQPIPSSSSELQNVKPSEFVDTQNIISDAQNSKPLDTSNGGEPRTASSEFQLPGMQNPKLSDMEDAEEIMELEKDEKNCDIFDGKWVYNPLESPLYDSGMCQPFFSDTVSCRRNGRRDTQYERWSWEANHCKIPRFNGKDMLERLRNKRVILVGDSINHSQWESLACLLYSTIPGQSYVNPSHRIFVSEAYNCSVEFRWTNFLVELEINRTSGMKILRLDRLTPDARKWRGADIMVFNTGHWWANRQRWDWYQYKRKLFEDMKLETAFKVAMRTWARWIERNVDANKTTVFFRGMSPPHFTQHWCYESTTPIMDESYVLTFGNTLKVIVEQTIVGMKAPVKYLNITKLSEYRRDAHSSIYGTKEGRLMIARRRKPPQEVADCSHWCLPGVPDTWNRLLYASMVLDGPNYGLQSRQPSLDPVQNTETVTSSSQEPISGFQNSQPGNNIHNLETNTPSQLPVTGSQTSQPAKLESSVEAGTSSQVSEPKSQNSKPETSDDADENEPIEVDGKCNIFDGKWVYDPKGSPLYDSAICPFFSNTVSCQKHGRPDKEYEKWNWEGKDCKIPRFNGKDMLKRLRGKRVIMVGDSINHGQWESLACLLLSAAPDKSHVDGHRWVFRSDFYNCSVEFHWANYLVQYEVNQTTGIKMLILDTIARDAYKWIGADAMIFNTGHWWQSRNRWDWFQYRGRIFKSMKLETAFKVAMKTWSRWIEKNVDKTKTIVYFRSISPAHFRKHWCFKERKPIMDEFHVTTYGKSLKDTVERTIASMRMPVTYLNITRLTDLRPDAHSSIYKIPHEELLEFSKTQKPQMLADCSHWCLPGVPDTWNRLLYASMVLDSPREVSTS